MYVAKSLDLLSFSHRHLLYNSLLSISQLGTLESVMYTHNFDIFAKLKHLVPYGKLGIGYRLHFEVAHANLPNVIACDTNLLVISSS